MESVRLQAEIWVKAQVRRCMALNVPAYIRHKGDTQRGSILIKISRTAENCQVYGLVHTLEGQRIWMPIYEKNISEADAEACLAKTIDRDPDLWVLEVEDPQGQVTIGSFIV